MKGRSRATIVLSLALSCLAAAAHGQSLTSEPQARDLEDTIRELETLWNEAHLHGDLQTLDSLWAPQLSVIVPEMPPFSKADLLEMWRSMKVTFSEYSTSDVTINGFGQTAVVTGRLHRSRDFGGRVATEDWLFTKVYAEFDSGWRVTAYHASVAPEP
jgi:ketosteroid isomerase-like protein